LNQELFWAGGAVVVIQSGVSDMRCTIESLHFRTKELMDTAEQQLERKGEEKEDVIQRRGWEGCK